MPKNDNHIDYLLSVCPRELRLGKCPVGFELQMIEIASGHKCTHKVDILAFVYGGLAIHKTPWGWHITHIRSGKKLAYIPTTKRKAIKAVKMLTKMFDWHLTESTLRRHGANATVKAVRDAT